jgi:hypothetical protein
VSFVFHPKLAQFGFSLGDTAFQRGDNVIGELFGREADFGFLAPDSVGQGD